MIDDIPSDGVPDDQRSCLSIHLRSVLIGETRVSFPRTGVTAVVGGNNVGKSTFLREIQRWIAREPSSEPLDLKVIQDLEYKTHGGTADLFRWLDENAHHVRSPQEGFVGSQGDFPITRDQASYYWSQKSLGLLSSFFIHTSLPLDRAMVVEPVELRADISDPPLNPLHVLQDDPAVLSAVNQFCLDVFRKPLTLDRLSGKCRLRVGQPGVEAPPVDEVTTEYRDALSKLPGLNEQGDGMRSLFGLLLPVITSRRPVVLIDEPEAFLHPPQAFQLGMILSDIAKDRQMQIVLATHDRNLLARLLAADTDVSIVRLDRIDDVTSAAQLQADEVEKLWTDPVMRYSNVLQGLFHRVVVVAEADPDCRFYGATLDAMNDERPLSIPPSEILFLASGGKDGMAKIVAALRAARVRVVACPDLDILDNPRTVKRIVEAFGGNWEELDVLYRESIHDLDYTPVDRTCAEVLNEIENSLGEYLERPWTNQTKRLIRPSLRTKESKFGDLKRFGIRAFKGHAACQADKLLDKLDSLGVCCVREGELERLAPTVDASKGRGWLPAALGAQAQNGEFAKKQAELILKAAHL